MNCPMCDMQRQVDALEAAREKEAAAERGCFILEERGRNGMVATIRGTPSLGQRRRLLMLLSEIDAYFREPKP